MSRSPARALGGGGLADAFCHQSGHTRRPVITGATSKARIHNDPDPINGEAGFGNGGGQNHLAIAAFAQRGLLVSRIKAPMQAVKLSRDPVQPFGRALNLPYAWQKGEDVSLFF